MAKPSEKALAFLQANAEFPVVAGSIIGRGGHGAIYELSNGETFVLTRDEAEQVGTPRWRGMTSPSNRMIPGAPTNR